MNGADGDGDTENKSMDFVSAWKHSFIRLVSPTNQWLQITKCLLVVLFAVWIYRKFIIFTPFNCRHSIHFTYPHIFRKSPTLPHSSQSPRLFDETKFDIIRIYQISTIRSKYFQAPCPTNEWQYVCYKLLLFANNHSFSILLHRRWMI